MLLAGGSAGILYTSGGIFTFCAVYSIAGADWNCGSAIKIKMEYGNYHTPYQCTRRTKSPHCFWGATSKPT